MHGRVREDCAGGIIIIGVEDGSRHVCGDQDVLAAPKRSSRT